MKKLLIIFLSFACMILFSYCSKQGNIDNTSFLTSGKTFSDTTSVIGEHSQANKTDENSSFSQKESFLSTTLEDKTESESSSKNNDEKVAPQILFLTLEDIAAIETAYNNMQEEEFKNFISDYPKHYEANGIATREEAKVILDEVKDTTVVLLDGDLGNVSEMYFYVERNEIQQSILIEDNKRLICTYLTPQKAEKSGESLLNSKDIELIGETFADDVLIELYKVQDSDSHYAELTVNDTVIQCRVTNMENEDEVKKCFERVSFRKIGDLLAE